MFHQKIIQGGMGIGVSDWRLARTVSQSGQIGVVSGTAIDTVFVRRLQKGDPDGQMRFALGRFPDQEFAQATLKKYFLPEGLPPHKSFSNLPLLTIDAPPSRVKLIVLANFVEVLLAKQGHDGVVGINLLEKIQMPILPSLYGAMLAGVDLVIMGAGIPKEIPSILRKLSSHEDVEYKLSVDGAAAGEVVKVKFSPQEILPLRPAKLPCPRFLPIVSSNALALTLSRKAQPPIDGLIIELPSAGGHNAPPRGPMNLNVRGEPIYGPRDRVDLQAISELGLPFWLAGQQGHPLALKQALQEGARGIQVGTPFALCNESGLDTKIKQKIFSVVNTKGVDIFTDPLASPTGFPFKVAQMEGTLSDDGLFLERKRRCNLGYLRQPYQTADGKLGYRCSAEPIDQYLAKGGHLEDTVGRKCLCNGLVSAIGLSHVEADGELPIVTLGDDAIHLARFLAKGDGGYSATSVIKYMLADESTQTKPIDLSIHH